MSKFDVSVDIKQDLNKGKKRSMHQKKIITYRPIFIENTPTQEETLFDLAQQIKKNLEELTGYPIFCASDKNMLAQQIYDLSGLNISESNYTNYIKKKNIKYVFFASKKRLLYSLIADLSPPTPSLKATQNIISQTLQQAWRIPLSVGIVSIYFDDIKKLDLESLNYQFHEKKALLHKPTPSDKKYLFDKIQIGDRLILKYKNAQKHSVLVTKKCQLSKEIHVTQSIDSDGKNITVNLDFASEQAETLYIYRYQPTPLKSKEVNAHIIFNKISNEIATICQIRLQMKLTKDFLKLFENATTKQLETFHPKEIFFFETDKNTIHIFGWLSNSNYQRNTGFLLNDVLIKRWKLTPNEAKVINFNNDIFFSLLDRLGYLTIFKKLLSKKPKTEWTPPLDLNLKKGDLMVIHDENQQTLLWAKVTNDTPPYLLTRLENNKIETTTLKSILPNKHNDICITILRQTTYLQLIPSIQINWDEKNLKFLTLLRSTFSENILYAHEKDLMMDIFPHEDILIDKATVELSRGKIFYFIKNSQNTYSLLGWLTAPSDQQCSGYFINDTLCEQWNLPIQEATLFNITPSRAPEFLKKIGYELKKDIKISSPLTKNELKTLCQYCTEGKKILFLTPEESIIHCATVRESSEKQKTLILDNKHGRHAAIPYQTIQDAILSQIMFTVQSIQVFNKKPDLIN